MSGKMAPPCFELCPPTAPDVIHVIALFREGIDEADVLVKPVARGVVLAPLADAAVVVAAVLKEDTDRLLVGSEDTFGIDLAASQIDEAAELKLATLRNSLGRSQATMKAAMAPELAPPIPRCSGSLRCVILLKGRQQLIAR